MCTVEYLIIIAYFRKNVQYFVTNIQLLFLGPHVLFKIVVFAVKFDWLINLSNH